MKRKTERVPGFPGIYKTLCYNEVKKKWSEPQRGNPYGVKGRVFVNGQKREVRETFATFQDAKVFWAKLKAGEIKVSSNTMTFNDLLMHWRELELPNRARSSQAKYESYLKHFAPLHHLKVSDIKPMHIDRLISYWKSPNYLAACKSSRCNFEKELTILKTIFTFYVERFDHTYAKPFLRSHNRAIVVCETKYIKKDLCADDFKRFIEALRQSCGGTKFEAIYYLALAQYATFSRIQEAAALHFEDVNLDNQTITVNKKVIWLRTKGQECFVEQGLKAGSGKQVPLMKLFEVAYREWLMKSGRREGLMFTIDDQIIHYRTIQHKYDQALKLAGLPFTATHIIRHASLTEAHDINHDLRAVQILAGHKDIQTTSRYVKVRQETLRDTVQQIGQRIAGTQKDAL